MQLAILLNLIYTKGNSLPDKITALYDGYVELFFDRESEKNSLVRDNRDILIDLHRYLGWHLHCLAETTNSNGSLSKDEIIETLSIYLEKEERDPKIAVTLFDGMIERVVFLVSRIVGRYEFEVQPLREYFAARHIYETAPSSSIGSECTDSKPDRLDALLRNNHWSNVTRFYVGCYSKGELSSILESIKNLIDDSNYTLTSIPYKITASFLSDWVFSQSRRSTSEAIRIVLSALGRQHMLTAGNGMRGGEVVRLPDGCGRKELVDECFRILSIEVHYDYLTEIAEILTSNATFEELKTTLEEKITASESSEAVMKWVRISSMLPVTYSLSNTSIEHCLRMTKYSPKCISILYNNNADLKIDNDENLKRIIMGLILDGDLTSPFMRNPLNEYKILSWLLSPRLYSTVFYGNSHARKLDQMFDRYGYFTKGRFEEEFEKLTGLGSSIMILVSKIRNLQGASIDEWKSSLKYWNQLVEETQNSYGDAWISRQIAFVSSNITSSTERGGVDTNIFDASISLCQRTRYMRLRRGQASWWGDQYQSITDVTDLKHFVTALIAWGSEKVITSSIDIINESSIRLNDDDWKDITNTLHLARAGMQDKLQDEFAKIVSAKIIDDRALSVISRRFTEIGEASILKIRLQNYQGNHFSVIYHASDVTFRSLATELISWDEALHIISNIYSKESNIAYLGNTFYRFQMLGEYGPYIKPSVSTAKLILNRANNYPRSIISIAEKVLDENVGESTQPIETVAHRMKWSMNSQ